MEIDVCLFIVPPIHDANKNMYLTVQIPIFNRG